MAFPAARGIMYDEAEKHVRDGHEVFFLFCDSFLDMCYINPEGNMADCINCKKNYDFEKRNLSQKINFISLDRESKKKSFQKYITHNFLYKTTDEIKGLKYNGINIGLACFSTYVTATRNINPKIDNQFKLYFDALLNNCINFYNIISLLIQEIKPDQVKFFNGRMMENRVVMECAQQYKISFEAIEMIKGVNSIEKMNYNNTWPFDMNYYINLSDHLWETTNVPKEERINLGKSFFERKKLGLYVGDSIYHKDPNIKSLPNNWNNTRRNIIIFNSSEDEYVSINASFDTFFIFSSQMEALNSIFKEFEDNDAFHFYLRIHPNLKNVRYKYHSDLLKFENLNNVSVISADSDISSYALLENAEKVIVFGSTIGIEAVYWGKPTILLGESQYKGSEACYIPKSKSDLFQLIRKYLSPKNIEPAIKYGYFLLNDTREKPEFIDFNYSYRSIGVGKFRFKIGRNNWQKIIGSRTLYTMLRYSTDVIIRLIFRKKRYNLPVEEE